MLIFSLALTLSPDEEKCFAIYIFVVYLSIKVLKDYLQQHQGVSLLELFQRNPFIFYSQTKVRSLISSLICDEVERSKGSAGIKALIDCGNGDDNYFVVVNNLIGINVNNFDTRVMSLLEKYK